MCSRKGSAGIVVCILTISFQFVPKHLAPNGKGCGKSDCFPLLPVFNVPRTGTLRFDSGHNFSRFSIIIEKDQVKIRVNVLNYSKAHLTNVLEITL